LIAFAKNSDNLGCILAKMHYKRSEILMEIRGLGDDDLARSIWKKLKGYHRRSLIETSFYRIKTMLGPNLKSRKLLSQKIVFTINFSCSIFSYN
jgi:hypothetical protein